MGFGRDVIDYIEFTVTPDVFRKRLEKRGLVVGEQKDNGDEYNPSVILPGKESQPEQIRIKKFDKKHFTKTD